MGPFSWTDSLAAVDLGSNSFHMVVAREAHGQARVVDRLRERVALAEGLGSQGELAREVEDRALDCLRRFRQRLTEVPRSRVRAVGTATFRKLSDPHAFLSRAADALGAPIEILPGAEEARLVYLGVAHTLGDDEGKRLVIDIGGGSTECIIGQRFEASVVDSLSMGCVRWSQRFFADGRITAGRLKKAEVAARIELESIETAYREAGWQSCIGSSGTILAIAEILARMSWSPDGITQRGLDKLSKVLEGVEHYNELEIDGLSTDRKPVIAGGLAILRAVFAAFHIEEMGASKGALREGLMYDLLGRIHHEDVRARNVQAFALRYQVDREQAQRVAGTAAKLFDQVQDVLELDDESRRHLDWAATLHEVGLMVSHSGHHKHGAYVVSNTDLPGFSRDEQLLLAALVRSHRRKISNEPFEGLSKAAAEAARRLTLILRLAVRLHRSRRALLLPGLSLAGDGRDFVLTFPDGWLVSHPLTREDLKLESTALRALGFELRVRLKRRSARVGKPAR